MVVRDHMARQTRPHHLGSLHPRPDTFIASNGPSNRKRRGGGSAFSSRSQAFDDHYTGSRFAKAMSNPNWRRRGINDGSFESISTDNSCHEYKASESYRDDESNDFGKVPGGVAAAAHVSQLARGRPAGANQVRETFVSGKEVEANENVASFPSSASESPSPSPFSQDQEQESDYAAEICELLQHVNCNSRLGGRNIMDLFKIAKTGGLVKKGTVANSQRVAPDNAENRGRRVVEIRQYESRPEPRNTQQVLDPIDAHIAAILRANEPAPKNTRVFSRATTQLPGNQYHPQNQRARDFSRARNAVLNDPAVTGTGGASTVSFREPAGHQHPAQGQGPVGIGGQYPTGIHALRPDGLRGHCSAGIEAQRHPEHQTHGYAGLQAQIHGQLQGQSDKNNNHRPKDLQKTAVLSERDAAFRKMLQKLQRNSIPGPTQTIPAANQKRLDTDSGLSVELNEERRPASLPAGISSKNCSGDSAVSMSSLQNSGTWNPRAREFLSLTDDHKASSEESAPPQPDPGAYLPGFSPFTGGNANPGLAETNLSMPLGNGTSIFQPVTFLLPNFSNLAFHGMNPSTGTPFPALGSAMVPPVPGVAPVMDPLHQTSQLLNPNLLPYQGINQGATFAPALFNSGQSGLPMPYETTRLVSFGNYGRTQGVSPWNGVQPSGSTAPVVPKPRKPDTNEQQAYEAWIELRKATEPGYAMECRLRQQRRAQNKGIMKTKPGSKSQPPNNAA